MCESSSDRLILRSVARVFQIRKLHFFLNFFFRYDLICLCFVLFSPTLMLLILFARVHLYHTLLVKSKFCKVPFGSLRPSSQKLTSCLHLTLKIVLHLKLDADEIG